MKIIKILPDVKTLMEELLVKVVDELNTEKAEEMETAESDENAVVNEKPVVSEETKAVEETAAETSINAEESEYELSEWEEDGGEIEVCNCR